MTGRLSAIRIMFVWEMGYRHKHTGLENEGFFGIGVKEGAEYRFSVWAL